MKIKSFELFQVPPRWLFLRIETDDGLVGWGEPIVEGKATTVKAAVTELMEYLVGKDPFHIEDHWNVMYRGGFYRGGPVLMSAISGIDQALWDIKGKYFNAPIYQLMGGKARDTIEVYSWIKGETIPEMQESAQQQVKIGFRSLKMNGVLDMKIVDSIAKVDQVVERVAAVRDAVGSGVGIGIDFHGRVSKPMAKVLAKAIEPLRPMFIEEPVLPENNEALRDIANHVAIPIATGERMYSRWHFKQLLKEGYVDIIQPDVSHAGGITECKKIVSMAEAFDVAAALHCPLGPIALAACLQIDASCINAFIQEQSLGVHYSKGNELLDYIVNKDVFSFQNGFLKIPDGPGLGIEMNEEHIRKMATVGHNWKNPLWRHDDGSVAEW